jgi:twitching motility protein PilT
VRNLIREDKIHQVYSSMQSGQEKFGMQTFNQALATAYFQKQISLEVALQRSSNVDELQEMINRGASCHEPGSGGRRRWPRERLRPSIKFRWPGRG